MAINKKYYYLKLKDNFFESDTMVVLESMPDGYLYSNILMKLYLRSLKNEGRLMFNDKIPYNPTILAQVTRHNVGVVEKAIKIFKDLDLIEIMDNGAIYLLDIQNYIGESSSEADRQREYQRRINTEKGLCLPEIKESNKKQCKKSNKKSNSKSTPEIEIDKEKEIYSDHVALTHSEFEKLVQEYGESTTQEYIERLNDYILQIGVDKASRKYKSHYAVIRNWYRRDKEAGKTASNRALPPLPEEKIIRRDDY